MNMLDHLITQLESINAYARLVIQHLPKAWYPMAVMSLLPTLRSIPGQITPFYLLAYCVFALIITKTPKKRTDHKEVTTSAFLGMKVTID